MKRTAIIFLALAGCTTTKYQHIPCLTPEQLEEQRKAEPPKVGDQLTGRADEDIRIIGGSAVRLRSWGQGMLDILGGCAGPAPQ